jgi:hypothetical protein
MSHKSYEADEENEQSAIERAVELAKAEYESGSGWEEVIIKIKKLH